MTKKMMLLLVVVLALAMVFTACGETASAPSSGGDAGEGFADKDGNGVLKIGSLVPTTGSEATYGIDMNASYQLAISEINAAGGVLGYTLELVSEDDACDTAQASTAAAKLVSAECDFIVGGYCSGATTPCLTTFQDADTIFISSAANSTVLGDSVVNDGNDCTFMLNATGDKQIESLEWLIADQGFQKLAVIHQGDDFTQNLYNEISKANDAGVLGCEFIPTAQVMEKGAADVSAIVTAVKQSGADAVFFGGYYADCSNVVKQLRQGGYEGAIIASDGCSDPNLATGCGEAGEGVWLLSPPIATIIEGSDEYIAKYKEANNGADPRAYSTLAYDTIYTLVAAIEQAGSIATADVKAALESIEYKGVEGTCSFSEGRHERVYSNFMIVQIHDQAFTLYHAF